MLHIVLIGFLILLKQSASSESSAEEFPVLVNNGSAVLNPGDGIALICQTIYSDGISEIRWLQDDKPINLTDNVKYSLTLSTERVTLSLLSFSQDDAGTYRCVVNNIVSNGIQLTKTRSKGFSSRMKDLEINLAENNTAVIPCSPLVSKPAPQTVFEIRGQTIDESAGRYFIMPNGDLQISNVDTSDSGDYRCIIINPTNGRKIPANNKVRLNVQSARELEIPKAVKITSGGNRIKVFEGDSIVLPCVYNGVPVPTITWDRYENERRLSLPQNRTKIINGNLIIQPASAEDSGTYKCIGENIVSQTPSVQVFILDVLAKPVINSMPSSITVMEGSSYNISCPTETSNKDGKIDVIWFLNGSVFVPDNENSFISYSSSSQLSLRNVQTADSGIYQCVALNQAGEASTFYKLSVQKPAPSTTTTTSKPTTLADKEIFTAPSKPKVIQVKNTGVNITWAINITDDLRSFQIKAKEDIGDWVTKVKDLPRQATFYEINGLRSEALYRFKVVAVYKGLRAFDSPTSAAILLTSGFKEDNDVKNITPAAASPPTPALLADTSSKLASTSSNDKTTSGKCMNGCNPPEMVIALSNKTASAGNTLEMLCWAAGENVTIRWYKNGYLLGPILRKIEIAQMDTLLYLIDAQPADSAWYRCEAKNLYGSVSSQAYVHVIEPNPTSKMTLKHTTQKPTTSADAATPEVPTVKVISPDEVQIEWQPIRKGLSVDRFRIQYRIISGDGHQERWQNLGDVSTDYYIFRVARLKPGTSYKFRVVAMYSNGQHKHSAGTEKITLPTRTSEKAAPLKPPVGTPEIVIARQTASDTLTIRWAFDGSNASSFVVQYRQAYGPSDRWQEFEANVEEMKKMEASLKGLQIGNVYLVRVVAQNAAGRSIHSKVVQREIKESFGFLSSSVIHDGDPDTASSADSSYKKSSNHTGVAKSKSQGNDMLYIIVGAVLGSMVLILIILVTICGVKQRQQRRALLSMKSPSSKFADPSKVLYGEQLKVLDNTPQFGMHKPLANGDSQQHGLGTMASVHSQREPRMFLNVNPMHDMEGPYHTSIVSKDSIDENPDYNLMQHYPHYNSKQRNMPTLPLYHQSHHSLSSHQDGSQHYSQSSLRQNDGQIKRSETPNQFSTFLPKPVTDSSAAPIKFPHPYGLRMAHQTNSPASSVSEAPQGGQKKKKRKRRNQYDSNHSQPSSGVDAKTNTDLSSDEGEGIGRGHFNRALPPPPLITENINTASYRPE